MLGSVAALRARINSGRFASGRDRAVPRRPWRDWSKPGDTGRGGQKQGDNSAGTPALTYLVGIAIRNHGHVGLFEMLLRGFQIW